MIDRKGYRANVGIILSNCHGQVFWGKRVGQDAWQFPQGGIKKNESHKQAMFRELHEEVAVPHSEKIYPLEFPAPVYRAKTALVRASPEM